MNPTAQRILLLQDHDGARWLLDIAADGSGFREIRKFTDVNNVVNDILLTPDEKYLVYEAGDTGHSDIWALPMRTGLFRHPGKPIRLTNGPLPYSSPYPSRDGHQIFALGTKQRGELVRYDMNSHQFLPFLSGISATDPTFSRDGKWVAYTSYPEHILWRSRSDGTERTQLTFPPTEAKLPFISPDGARVSFNTPRNEVYVVGIDGNPPQRIAENSYGANWSPDGNLLVFTSITPPFEAHVRDLRVYDLRTGKVSVVPSSSGRVEAIWITQDTLVAADTRIPNTDIFTKLWTFDFKTQKWTALPSADAFVDWMISPDRNYLYLETAGAETEILRLRFADRQIESITSLKDLHHTVNFGDPLINVAPDGSPIFTRDTGYQEIYALNIRWP